MAALCFDSITAKTTGVGHGTPNLNSVNFNNDINPLNEIERNPEALAIAGCVKSICIIMKNKQHGPLIRCRKQNNKLKKDYRTQNHSFDRIEIENRNQSN